MGWSLFPALCALIISCLINDTNCQKEAEACPAKTLGGDISEDGCTGGSRPMVKDKNYELLHRASAAFTNLDSARSDGDAVVTAEDLKAILGGLHISTSGTSKLMKLMDVSNDGKVNYGEYFHIMDLLTMFKTVDTDESGIISLEELKALVPEDVLRQVDMKKELKDKVLDLYEFAQLRMKLRRQNMSLSIGVLDALVESVQENRGIPVENIIDVLAVFKVENIKKEKLLKVLDINGDGKLDISEFTKTWDLLLQFKIVDSNHSNFVSRKELQSLFDSQTNTKPRSAIEEIKKINKGKKLNFVDFVTLMS